MTECELCEKRSAILDFNRVCCRVRFVMSLPSREMRAGWLERWKQKDGAAMAEEVEKEVKRQWEERKRHATPMRARIWGASR